MLSITLLFTSHLFYFWGFYAHKLINEHAIYTLPTEMALYYKHHRHEIIERSVDADKRSYVDSAESIRHYIDIEDYQEEKVDSIPIHWSHARAKYPNALIQTAGIIPWHINLTYERLVEAFKNKNNQRIIRLSADLGHYIADAHVPLHTTTNYNGQLTNQIGIHAFWESRLPEMFADKYDLLVGRAYYIDSPIDHAWTIVKKSHILVDSVLSIEHQLSQQYPVDVHKSYIKRNNTLVYTYSDTYAHAYHEALNNMVERRMAESIRQIGSYWYSAWIDAGQPNLSFLIHSEDHIYEVDSLEEWRPSQGKGREEWH